MLDTSKKLAIRQVADIELSSNEDSVQSLAVAQSEEDSAVLFAGINSSKDEQKQRKNEHLRSFAFQYPGSGATGGAPKEALYKSSLFKPDARRDPDTWQRVIRLSRPTKEQKHQLGAVATGAAGLAPEGEIIIFDASRSRVEEGDVRKRIDLGKKQEAADVDIIDANDKEFYVVYCLDYELHMCRVPSDKPAAAGSPHLLYHTPLPDSFAREKRRPQFRSLRFLTPRLLLVLLNLPGKTGAELLLLDVDEKALLGTVILRKSLHKGIKRATALSVALLPAPSPSQNVQHVIAIAGQESCVQILTIDHNPRFPVSLSFKQYAFLRDLHLVSMTSICFSTFNPPSDPVTATPQYLKLASTGIKHTVIVHNLPLIPTPSPVAKRKPGDPPTRYVLQKPGGHRSEVGQLSLSALGAVIMVALGAFMLQAIIEIRGGSPEYIGAKTWLSKPLRDKIALPYMFTDQQNPILTDNLSPVESPLRKAYKVVEEAIPADTEELKESVTKTARETKHSAEHHHRRLRDLLRRRSTLLETSGNDEADDIEGMPLFSQVFGDESTDPSTHAKAQEPPTILIRAHPPSDEHEGSGHTLVSETHSSEEQLMQERAQGGEGSVKKWEDLKPSEKKSWLRRLENAGVETLQEADAILKGVFFSEIAGVVAGAVRGGI